MRLALAIALTLALSLSPVASARTFEPGTDESRAGMCDAFDGLPFVFCVAMCEARECDRQPFGDDRCAVLAEGFANVTNGATPPCTPASGTNGI